MIEILIWTSLAVTVLTAMHMSVERWLFYGTHRPADQMDLENCLRLCATHGLRRAAAAPGRLGWLKRVLPEADSLRTLRKLCLHQLGQVDHYGGWLRAMPNLAQAVGLTGTVAGIVLAHDATRDVSTLLSISMGSTFAGLVVAIVISSFLVPFESWQTQIQGQIGAVLKVTEDPADGSAVVPGSVFKGPAAGPNGAAVCQETASATRLDGPEHRASTRAGRHDQVRIDAAEPSPPESSVETAPRVIHPYYPHSNNGTRKGWSS